MKDLKKGVSDAEKTKKRKKDERSEKKMKELWLGLVGWLALLLRASRKSRSFFVIPDET